MLKKVLILLCLVGFVFLVTSSVMAEGVVRVDWIPAGSDVLAADSDLNQTGRQNLVFVSFDGNIHDFRYGIDLGTGSSHFKADDIITSKRDYDFSLADYRFGVRFLDYERVKLDLMFSRLLVQFKDEGDKISENGNMLGCDALWLINDKLSLDGYLGYSVFGADYDENSANYDPAYIGALKARINYAVSQNLALSLGVRGVFCLVNDYRIGAKDKLWRGFGGYLVGVKYSF